MKNLKLLVVALVAMVGFIACDKHECNGHNHSADLVGTWTCLEAGYPLKGTVLGWGRPVEGSLQSGVFCSSIPPALKSPHG